MLAAHRTSAPMRQYDMRLSYHIACVKYAFFLSNSFCILTQKSRLSESLLLLIFLLYRLFLPFCLLNILRLLDAP